MRNGGAAHKNPKRRGFFENNEKCVVPWRRDRPKARDRLPRRGRILQNGRWASWGSPKNDSRRWDADTYVELCPAGHSIRRRWRDPSPGVCSAREDFLVPSHQSLATSHQSPVTNFSHSSPSRLPLQVRYLLLG